MSIHVTRLDLSFTFAARNELFATPAILDLLHLINVKLKNSPNTQTEYVKYSHSYTDLDAEILEIPVIREVTLHDKVSSDLGGMELASFYLILELKKKMEPKETLDYKFYLHLI